MSLNIEKLLLPEKVVTFDYPGCEGLTFDLAFLSKDELVKIQKASTNKKLDNRTRQVIEKFDDDKFLELYVSKIIRGWSGFKLKYLSEMVLTDTEGQNLEEELEFSTETAVVIMKSSSVLDSWVSEQISDLGNFSNSNSTKNKKESKNTSKVVAKESTETNT